MADLSMVPKRNGTSECQHRYFEEGVYTIVTEWDLVCDNLAAYSTTYAAVQVGILIGSLVFGYLIGRLGRRRVLLITSVLFSPAAFLTAAATSVSVFTALRVITNMAVIGMYFAGFVLCIEICSLSQRSLVSSYFVLPWTLGYMGTAAIAYFVRPWRYLQAALSTPSVLVFMFYWVVPESPRWLCQRGRHEEALDVLKTFAKKNKRILPDDEKMIAALQRVQSSALASANSNNIKKNDCCSGLSQWLKNWIAPQLDCKTPIVFFIWFASAIVYYGVSQGASNFGLDEYLFVFVGGLLEIFAYLMLWPGVALLGSRTVVSITFAVTAASILGVMGLQIAGQSGENIWLVLLSYLGKFMISAAFQGAYIVTGELFSTNLRSLMIGESSVCGRIGSMSSPYVNNLMGRDYNWAPAAFYGVFSMLAAILAAVLPQTKGVALDIHQSSNKDQSKGNTSPVESTPHEETRL